MGLGGLGALLLPVVCYGQTNALTFQPADAQYSVALDKIIMISANPNQLHIYDAGSNSDVTVTLPDTPLNVSVSPDGMHAAVAQNNSISYVNLSSASVDQVFAAPVGTGKVALSATYIYVLPSYEGNAISINIATGQTSSHDIFYGSGGRLDPTANAIYGTQDGISPNNINKYDVSNGPITAQTPAPYHGDYPVCGPLWFSTDGSRIYSGCSTVFRSSSDPTQDMTYVSSLPGLQNVQALSESAAIKRVAAVPVTSTYSSPVQSDGEVRLFESDYLNQVGRFVMPPFVVGSNSYQAHSRWVFFNRSGSSLFVVLQADSSSGLLNNYAVTAVALANPVACAATFSATSATSVGSGSLGAVGISAGTGCTFQAASNVSWIQLISGGYGSGNNTLTYAVRPNTGSQPRTGTISLGSQTLTIAQDAAIPASSFNRLSVEVLAADYSKALDSIVFAAKGPNELHIYNPVSLVEQVVPLAAAPLSLSVRPDGLYAAVGHAGWISYINLQSASVEQVFPVDTDVAGIVLASNGYIYAFPQRDWSDIYSLEIASGAWTPVSAIYDGRVPRLHQSGKYLYVGGNWFSKWDIRQGPATLINSSPGVSTCGNLWLTEDGNRIFTACGSVYESSEIASLDFSPNGKLAGNGGILWAAHSIQQHETAVITSQSTSHTTDDTKLQIYGDAYLNLTSQSTLPSFTVNGSNYTGHGRFVFWNSSESKLFSLIQADSTAGLMSDYAVYTLDQSSTLPQCTFALGANSFSVGAAGSVESVAVTSTSACGWTAYPGDSWLTITSGSSGSGAGVVNFSIASSANSSSRSTNLTVAGQTIAIRQAGAGGCAFGAVPNYAILPSQGANQSVAVTAGSDCSWTAGSNASWLTITAGMAGSGNGTVTYSADPNLTSSSRTAAITIGDQTLTIEQSANGETAAGLQFIAITPCRVVDTRNANGLFGGPVIAGDSSRDFPISNGSCGIPASAQAYALNVTVAPTGPLGYITVWPTGEPQPLVSTLNSYDGRVKANAAIVPAGAAGGISVFATNDTHVVLDISGYFVPAAGNTGLAFYPLTPCRIADTRAQAGQFGGPSITAQQARTFAVLSSACNVPSSAQAYSLNFTAIPQGALGYLTTWPAGQAQPTVSTLNAPTGTVVANAAILPAGTNGNVSVFATNDTDLVIDINGYFAPPGQGGLLLYNVPPCRVLDTRAASGGQPPTGRVDVNVGSSACSVPAAAAYVFNATAVPSGGLGYLSLWPAGGAQPLVSTLNAGDAAVTSNMAIVPAANASISAYLSNAAHLILDIFGYFAP